MTSLTFAGLREANVTRCEDVFHPLMFWSLPEWACAMAGEAGEACNVVKKMNRGDYDGKTLLGQADLAAELADVVIYLDLLAARAGIDLGEAVREKFNIVSERRGSKICL